MKAVILAAGRATRMHPFSKTKPKALIQLANKPLLKYTFAALENLKNNHGQKIDEIIIITGYGEDQIKKYYKDVWQVRSHDESRNVLREIKLTYVTQNEQLGTGHAALLAKPYINKDEQFFLLNGDDLYTKQDLQKLTQYENAILVQEKDDVFAFGVVTIDKSTNKVIGLLEKPQGVPPSNLINTGAFIFTPNVFKILESIKPSSRGEIELTCAVKQLADFKKIHAVQTQGSWSPVGYPWNILEATKHLLNIRSEKQILHFGSVHAGAIVESEVSMHKSSTISKGTRITGLVIIGKNVHIKENVTITGPVAIGNGTTIHKNSIISNAVIGMNSTIKEHCHIHDSVIGDNVTICKNVATSSLSPNETIKVMVKEKPYDTKLHQLGSFIADNVELSNNTSPGQIVE